MAKKSDQRTLGVDVAQLTREHGWDDVAGGKVEKWEKGLELLGTFLRMKDGSLERADGTHAKLLVIRDQKADTRVFGVPAILESMLEGFMTGDGVYILCLGKTRETAGTAKFGNAAWDFSVKRRKVQTEVPF